MIEFIKANKQLIGMMLIWVIVGMVLKELALVLIPLCFLKLKSMDRITDIIIAFTLIVFMADNRHHELRDFAEGSKEIILLLLAALFFFNQKDFKERSKLFVPFIVFLLWSFAMVAKSPIPFESFQKTVSFSLVLIVLPTYFVKELRRNGEYFLNNLIWFTIFFLVLSLVMIPVIPDWVFPGLRYSGLLGNPNGVGTVCTLLVILIALAKFHYPEIFTQKQLYFMYTIIAISVILCNSRNSIFSILIFLFFQRFYKISYFYGFIIVIITALASQLISENFVAIVNTLGLGDYLRVNTVDTGGSRTIAWAYAWQEIQKVFFMGGGFGYETNFFYLNRAYLFSIGHEGAVHNSYLTLWMNTGLIGLIMFLAALMRIFLKAASSNFLAIPAMFAILFSITFESWASASLSPFTPFFLLILTLLQFKNHETPAQENTVPVL